jgi:hypothetical protein
VLDTTIPPCRSPVTMHGHGLLEQQSTRSPHPNHHTSSRLRDGFLHIVSVYTYSRSFITPEVHVLQLQALVAFSSFLSSAAVVSASHDHVSGELLSRNILVWEMGGSDRKPRIAGAHSVGADSSWLTTASFAFAGFTGHGWGLALVAALIIWYAIRLKYCFDRQQ